MRSLILRTATRFLLTLMLLFSFFLLIRGHDQPGGGFIGGLIGAGAFTLYAIAFGARATRRALRLRPTMLIAIGLTLAIAAGLTGVLAGYPFLTGIWTTLDFGPGPLKLGTPLLFDLGVYLVVIGVTLTMTLALEEE